MKDSRKENITSDLSVIHGLNAAVKIFCFLLASCSVLLTSTFQGFAVMLVLTACFAYLSGAELKEHFGKLKGLLGISLVILLFNTCFYLPQYAKIGFWIFHPSFHGAVHAMAIVLRMLMIASVWEVLVSTTADESFFSAFALLLSPLAFVGIPVGRTAFILTEAKKIVPKFRQAAEKVRFMQKARGVLNTDRGFSGKTSDIKAVFIPALLSVLSDVRELADSIDAKGGVPEINLIRDEDKQVRSSDIFAIIVCFSVFIMQVSILR